MKKWVAIAVPSLFFVYLLLRPLLTEPVKISDVALVRSQQGVYLMGSVINTHKAPIPMVTLKLRFLDGDHREVGISQVDFKDIPGRGKLPFRSEVLALSNVKSYLIEISSGHE